MHDKTVIKLAGSLLLAAMLWTVMVALFMEQQRDPG